MTVGELKEKLAEFDGDLRVEITDPGSLVVLKRDGSGVDWILSFGDD